MRLPVTVIDTVLGYPAPLKACCLLTCIEVGVKCPPAVPGIDNKGILN